MRELHQHEIAAFLRCARKFDYMVNRNWEPFAHSDIIHVGSAFHTIVAGMAGKRDSIEPDVAPPALALANDMAFRYSEHVWKHDYPHMKVLHVEDELHYVGPGETPIVFRPDLVYEREGVIYVRDYKTMGRLPDNDMRTEDDLDFQANLYLLGVQSLYPDRQVVFEYEFIRAAEPRDPELTQAGTVSKTRIITTRERYAGALRRNGQGDDPAYRTTLAGLPTEADYFGRARIHRSPYELQGFQEELRQVIWLMLTAEEGSAYPRTVIKTGGEKCGGCSFFSICKRELYGDRLDDNTIKMMGYKQRNSTEEVQDAETDPFG